MLNRQRARKVGRGSGWGGKGSARGEEGVSSGPGSFQPCASPCLAAAPHLVALCSAGRHHPPRPPFPALARSQPRAGHQSQELSGEGGRQNTSLTQADPGDAGLQGTPSRSRCKGVPPRGEEPSPSTDVPGTTVAPVVQPLSCRCTCTKLQPPRGPANNGEGNHQSTPMASPWQCPFKGTYT